MTVTVFAKSNCTACSNTERALSKRGVDFKVVNVEENLDVAQSLVDEGFRAMPVVKLSNGESWSGLKLDKIKEHFGD